MLTSSLQSDRSRELSSGFSSSSLPLPLAFSPTIAKESVGELHSSCTGRATSRAFASPQFGARSSWEFPETLPEMLRGPSKRKGFTSPLLLSCDDSLALDVRSAVSLGALPSGDLCSAPCIFPGSSSLGGGRGLQQEPVISESCVANAVHLCKNLFLLGTSLAMFGILAGIMQDYGYAGMRDGFEI